MFTPNYLAKIEGHGKLNIDFDNNKAKLIVDEGERYFEALVRGRKFYDIPFIVSRICGVCPTSHYLASIKALENAFGVTPSDTTIILRKILLLGQIAQSHILHTVFLALPDYINVDNISDISKKCPAEFSSALRIKKITDKVVEVIGGRAVHPVTPTIGGFTKLPSVNELEKLRCELMDSWQSVENITKFFVKINYPHLVNETEYLALDSDREYSFYEGIVMSSQGYGFKPEKYKKEIQEKVVAGSSAKIALHNNKSFMVGALSRISIHPHRLNANAKNILDKLFENTNFPSANPYHNNLAQAIEIMHSFEEMIKLLDKIITSGSIDKNVKYEAKAEEGFGAIEAPRGTLYHYYKIDKGGKIIDADIITPTVQNLANLESDVNKLMNTSKSLSNKKRTRLVEMLVRAYDPCITCSVH